MKEPRLKINWLQQFVTLCQEDDFAQAAIQLNLSPRTLQYNIRVLEKAVGRSLIQQKGKDFCITSDGRMFLSYAEHTIKDLNSLMMDVKELNTDMSQGTVTLAWQLALHFETVAQALTTFMRTHTQVYTRILNYPQLDLIEKSLLKNQLDIAITDYPPVNTDLLAYSGRSTPYVIVSKPQPQRHWSAFSYIQIGQSPPEHIPPPWDDHLYPRQIIAHSNTVNAIPLWTDIGIAAFVPQSLVSQELEQGTLEIVAHPPQNSFKRPHICLSPASTQDAAVRALFEQLRQTL